MAAQQAKDKSESLADQPGVAAKDTPAPDSLPYLECVDRVKKFPIVEAALNQSTDLYGKVKGSSGVLTWTFNAAEATVQKAMEQAAPIAGPIAKKLETPIGMMDKTLCKGLNLVENTLPIVKEPPQQIYETAIAYRDKVCAVKNYGTQKAKSLKELSWAKANEVLSTRYGMVAYSTFDQLAMKADQYLNYYFPPSEEELALVKQDKDQPEAQDKVLHTVQTVGRLSNKLGKRVYDVLSKKISTLNKQSVQEYINSLLAAIHLTNYLNFHSSTASVPVTPTASLTTQSTQTPKPPPPQSS